MSEQFYNQLFAAMQLSLPQRVKSGKAQIEHKFSGSPPKADVSEARRHVRAVPEAEVAANVRTKTPG